jgi:hypothetical protein
MTEGIVGAGWFNIAMTCFLLGLLVWLRWLSGLWQHRSTGFCLGIVVALSAFLAPGTAPRQIDFARRYDIPGRVSLIGGIACLPVSILEEASSPQVLALEAMMDLLGWCCLHLCLKHRTCFA